MTSPGDCGTFAHVSPTRTPGLPIRQSPSGTAPAAIGVGLAEVLLLTLLPVVWIVRTEARRHATLAASTLLFCLAILLSTPVLSAFVIRSDVPALDFGTMALACAWTEGRRQPAWWRWTGAAAVVAAAGSKQVLVPLLVVYGARSVELI